MGDEILGQRAYIADDRFDLDMNVLNPPQQRRLALIQRLQPPPKASIRVPGTPFLLGHPTVMLSPAVLITIRRRHRRSLTRPADAE